MSIAASLDWRNYIRIAPVRNQGRCGSCSAFAAVAIVEAQFAINKTEVDLSEQFVMDCYRQNADGEGSGCNGGWIHDMFSWLKSNNRGIPTRTDVPYEAKNKKCTPKSLTDQWKTYYI
ncbi:hypothetical protein PMAYCL1PPCAC_25835, partial [Pristionchus mayeri]